MNMTKIVRKFIPEAFRPMAKKIFRGLIGVYGYFKNYPAYKSREAGKKIYLIGTPEHSNLGDHAIAAAILEFLERELPDYQIYEISFDMYNKHCRCIKKFINKKDVILINGGGSMGVEWFFYEELIRLIIKQFPHNRIVIMPQTIFYGDSEYGRREFERSRGIYSAHGDLHIIAREKYSYEIMKNAYPDNRVYLKPDAVLYLNRAGPRLKRDGILICLRNDVEKSLTQAQCAELIESCRQYTGSIRYTDTISSCEHIPLTSRNTELEMKFSEFRSSRLVITDRLHGMIFCAITETPCIALGNYNHKVKGVYEWIRDLNYIRFLDDCRDVKKYIPELYSLQNCSYDNQQVKSRFAQIAMLLEDGKVVV